MNNSTSPLELACHNIATNVSHAVEMPFGIHYESLFKGEISSNRYDFLISTEDAVRASRMSLRRCLHKCAICLTARGKSATPYKAAREVDP